MSTIIFVIVSGLIATALMSLFMELLTKSDIADADMIRAVGSIMTKSYEEAFKTGLMIQFGFGVFFAFIYFFIFGYFVSVNLFIAIMAGFAIGFFHGMVVSLGIIIIVAEHHPVERFRNAGFEVAVGHVAGHIIYGLTLGAIYGITGLGFFGVSSI